MTERERLRELAKWWRDAAENDVNEEHRAVWRGMNAMRPIRPAVLVETASIRDFVEKDMLLCTDPYLRGIEKMLLETILHFQEIPDDFVVENEFVLPYDVSMGDFGFPIEVDRPEGEDQVAFHFRHPVHSVEEAARLRPRRFTVDRASSVRRLERLSDIFGDILPVRLGGIDPERAASTGYTPFNGQNVTCITMNLFIHLGMERLYYWLVDEPEAVERMLALFTQDFIDFSRFMEREGLLADNRCNMLTGGHYGYGEEPAVRENVRLDTQWLWCNAEELTSVSPDMFRDVAPFLAKAAEPFGHIYYACCDRLDDRLDIVLENIPSIQAVSVSAFSDVDALGEQLRGRPIIFSRKPKPWFFAAAEPDWPQIEADLRGAARAARGCNYEFILRDVYDIFGDRKRMARFVELARNA